MPRDPFSILFEKVSFVRSDRKEGQIDYPHIVAFFFFFFFFFFFLGFFLVFNVCARVLM